MLTRVATDTATIVIYDRSRLRHRLNDVCDWWSDPDEEIAEINQGNVLFVSTGCDGIFDIEILTGMPPEEAMTVQALIKNDSGYFFIGAGECVSGEGKEPRAEHGNSIVEYPAGIYRITVWIEGGRKVCLRFEKAELFVANRFDDSPSVA